MSKETQQTKSNFILVIVVLSTVVVVSALVVTLFKIITVVSTPTLTSTPEPESTTISTSPVPTEISEYVLETFDYNNQVELANIWDFASSGLVNISLSNSTPNPPALQIFADVPCADARFMFVQRYFSDPEDWSEYEVLSVNARGDGILEQPYGSEFSVILWDAAGSTTEMWQSTRWLQRETGWTTFKIQLTGSASDDDPWNHPDDFVLLDISPEENGQLDLTQIEAIGFRAFNTAESCDSSPASDIFVDDVILR